MDEPLIYHNPRCSKSRQTLEILTEEGKQPEIIKYLETPPDATQIKDILHMLKISPRELMRRGEKIYKELDLDNDQLGDDDLIKAMADNPILIERPIVISNGKAIIGRPPELVRDIL